jgi:PAS domain S-box-containing protein
LENLLHTLPSLSSIVNRTPAIADPEMLLSEAIYMMSQNRGNQCLLPDLDRSNTAAISSTQAHIQQIAESHSAVLVLERGQLVGIFTEQDLVRLTATQTNLRGIEIGAVMTRNPQTLVLSAAETVISALSILEQYKIRHLPIIDDRSQLLGTISTDAIRQILQPLAKPLGTRIDLLKFRSVREEMTVEVVRATVDANVLEITQLMVAHQVSSVVIIDGERPVGIVTEQDIVQFQLLELDFDRLSVRAVMSAPLFCLQPADSLWMAQQMMETNRIRRLVVTGAREELCGIVTQSNLLKALDPLEMLRVVGSLQSQLMERAARLEQINRELSLEIARRQQVEERLRRASLSLKEQISESTAESSVLTERVQSMALDRESVELALEVSQQGISDFMQNAMIGIHWVDKDGIVVWANRSELEMLGYDSADYIGHNLHNFHVVGTAARNESRAAIKGVFQKLLNNQPIIGHESQMWRKDGSICDVSIDCNALFKDGKFIHARCFTRDISEQKQAEAALRQSEQKFREQAAMLDVATDAIIVRDLTGEIQFWNAGAELIYGWQAADVVGLKTTMELFNSDSSLAAIIACETVLQQGAWQGELAQFTQAGKEVIVESRWSLVRDAAGDPKSILSVDTDITAKKLLEQQFLRVQRLESLGTLASGIAHDLNNILTPILGAAQLLPLTLPVLDDRNQRLLTMLVDSSQRGSHLVKQILTFAKGLDDKPRMLQVRHILTEIIEIARQTFPKSIDINLDLDSEDLWMVCVDATQIHQVLMNLFVNARDAMPNGGSLVATARNEILDDTYTKLHPNISAGAYVAITIADTGIGMDNGTLDRIFDSFFTTKAAGTGLGLSTVMGIVKAHGGFVTVESAVDRGSSFKIYLPAVKTRVEEQLAATPESFDGQGKLVLIVDDEIAIREITRDSLEMYNYHTLLANDGVEALTLYAQSWQRIEVVTIDMMMPHLDTPSVIQALQLINPAVKIIVMSGSANNEGIIAQYGLKAFLTKPFTTIDLMQALADVSEE